MKKFPACLQVFFAVSTLFNYVAKAQNVGIGTTTPTGPLSFANTLGNKIVLWGDGNSAHYGIGVQSTVLQLYADQPNTAIAFGHGRSGAFTERVRITNGTADGMFINGRVHMRNGTNPLNIDFTPGVWLYKPDNSGALGFMGTQNNQNIGFFGGPGGWGFVYDAINSRVGIGTPTPVAPLTFGGAHGTKLVLHAGNSGMAGFTTQPNKLIMHAENSLADVSIGHMEGGTLTERITFKAIGAISIFGNSGSNLQVLGSQGPNSSVIWMSGMNFLYSQMQEYVQTSNLTSTNYGAIPGLSQTFTFSRAVKLLVSLTGNVASVSCFACGSHRVAIGISINQLLPITTTAESSIANGDIINITTGMRIIQLNPGTYTLIPVISNPEVNSRSYTAYGFRFTVIPIPFY